MHAHPLRAPAAGNFVTIVVQVTSATGSDDASPLGLTGLSPLQELPPHAPPELV